MNFNIKELYEKYGPMVIRRCRYLLKNEEAAFDAAQEVFLKLIEKQDSLKIDYPSSLLYRMATNVCLNIIRDNRKESGQDTDTLLQYIAAEEDHSDHFILREFIDEIFQKELPGTREIAVMHFIDKMTYEEISKEVKMSVSGIRKRLRKLSQNAKSYAEASE